MVAEAIDGALHTQPRAVFVEREEKAGRIGHRHWGGSLPL